MVRIHPAAGTGRRWASEIEITGMEGKVAKTTALSIGPALGVKCLGTVLELNSISLVSFLRWECMS